MGKTKLQGELFSCYKQGVIINGFISEWQEVSRTVTVSPHMKLGRLANTLEDRSKSQNDFDRLGSWHRDKWMGFNTEKCEVLHPGKNNQKYTHRMGDSCLDGTTAVKDLGLLVHPRLNMSQ